MQLAVIAHPNSQSFCHALCRTYNQFYSSALPENELVIVDLYKDGFDPVLSQQELDRNFPLEESSYAKYLSLCTKLHLFFPDWWGAEPAIMKGFLDKVFRNGLAYLRDDRLRTSTEGLLMHCVLSLWITSDCTNGEECRQRYRERFQSIVNFCGFNKLQLRIFAPMYSSKLSQRRAWLAELQSSACNG